MVATRRQIAAIACACLLLQFAALSFGQPAPQQQSQQQSEAEAQAKPPATSIRVTSELVLANVVVRDKKGNLVRDLKKEDFTLFEDGKKQDISTFDFENVDQLETAGAAEKTVTGEAAATAGPASVLKKSDAPVMNARDRRVIVLYFDFSAMEPDQIDRCVDSAKKYINGQMRPADIVALVSLSTNMRVDLDFTDDKPKILSVLSSYASGSGEGFAMGDTGSSEGSAETGGSFTPDDTDYNTFSADWKLLALQSTMQALGKIEQKKSLIYFSNGISQTGSDNQCFDLSSGRARLASIPSGRGSAERQLAWAIGVQRKCRIERPQWQCRFAGNLIYAGRGHRRQGVLRFQRFQRRLYASAER
jgi:VWFA-related protein